MRKPMATGNDNESGKWYRDEGHGVTTKRNNQWRKTRRKMAMASNWYWNQWEGRRRDDVKVMAMKPEEIWRYSNQSKWYCEETWKSSNIIDIVAKSSNRNNPESEIFNGGKMAKKWQISLMTASAMAYQAWRKMKKAWPMKKNEMKYNEMTKKWRSDDIERRRKAHRQYKA